jgi:hypothetical protein
VWRNMSSEAIGSALNTIQARLTEVEHQIEALAAERQALEQAERSLLVVLGQASGPPNAMAADPHTQPGNHGSLRSRLQEVLKEAGPSGHTIQELRRLFSDTKSTTLAATLSNLKRAGLVDTRGGHWFIWDPTELECSGTGGTDIADVGGEPQTWHSVNEPDYEVVTHPRTGVSLARRA